MLTTSTACSGLAVLAFAALASTGAAEVLPSEVLEGVQAAAGAVGHVLESAGDLIGELLQPQFWLNLAGVAQPLGTP